MRRHPLLIPLSFLVALVAGSAATAVNLPFEADLTVRISAGAGAQTLTISGGGVAVVNGSGAGGGLLTAFTMAAGAIDATAFLDVSDPGAFPIDGVILDVANAAGSFARGARLTGVMGLPGVARFCLFDECAAPPPANLSIPLTPVGAGGTVTQPGAVTITVAGAPWTTGTAMAFGLGGTVTHTGFARGPASLTGSTAQAGGELLLVTPIVISTGISIDGPITGFAFLAVRFVPEPATALLVGGGLALLLQMGRRRLRSA